MDEDPAMGEDLELIVDRLRKGKEIVKEKRDDDINWEISFELRHTALCEFALEHGYGVSLVY